MKMVMRGFALAQGDIQEEKFTLEKFQKIKGWGFNTVLITLWWATVENEDGSYNTTRIQHIKNQVALAKQAGLKVIVSFRVCYKSEDPQYWWTTWGNGYPTHYYTNETTIGRQRYAKFLGDMAAQFNDCMICTWHYPYHSEIASDSARTTFYNTTLPLLVDAVRGNNNNKIIAVPIHQGGYSKPAYPDTMPFLGNDVVYAGVEHTIPWSVIDGGEWNGDTVETDLRIGRAAEFKQKHNVEMVGVEYAPLQWNGEGLSQSRLDSLQYSVNKMSDAQIGFMYWRISLASRSGDNVLSDITNFEANPNILTILQSYKVVEPPMEDNRFLLFLLIGLGLFGVVLMSL